MGTKGFFGWAQPLVARLCQNDPVNARFCLEADAATRHYVALALRGHERHGAGETGFRHLSQSVARESRREVVAAAWGEDLGPLDILRRCAGRLFGRPTYDGLASALADRDRRRALGRSKTISASVVRIVGQADPELLTALGPAFLARIGSGSVAYLVDGVCSRRPDLDRTAVVESLRKATDTNPSTWLDRILLGTRLPRPPWPGTAEVRPVRTPKELRAVSLTFRNCLNSASHRQAALCGDPAYYLCDGRHPAVACLVQDRLLKAWRVEEIKGPQNAAVPPRSLDRIVSAFQEAGFPCLPEDPVYALEFAA